jgi:lysozyme
MVKVFNISDNCLRLIIHFECSGHIENFLKAYKDVAGVWTIGCGTIVYPDGNKVKEGDIITLDEANEYLQNDLQHAAKMVDVLTTDAIEQHQFDALVSFVFNEGETNYRLSTLRKRINENPKNFPAIVTEFLRWHYASHKNCDGLTRRRKAEAMLYVFGELKFYFTNNDNII